MNVTAVSMVKDEQDIIEHTIRNFFDNQGVEKVIIADNMSTDDTPEILRNLQDEYNLEVIIDSEIGYYQSEKMTALAKKGFEQGADWVIPFDADEFWTGYNEPIANVLERHPTKCAQFYLFNYYCTSFDDPDEPNPYKRIQHHDRIPGALRKVAVQDDPCLIIEQGNHGARGLKGFDSGLAVGGFLGHFPWRRFEQLVSKARNGAAAYKAAEGVSEDFGAHWRGYGRVLEEFGENALRENVWEQWFFDPPVDLLHEPIYGVVEKWK